MIVNFLTEFVSLVKMGNEKKGSKGAKGSKKSEPLLQFIVAEEAIITQFTDTPSQLQTEDVVLNLECGQDVNTPSVDEPAGHLNDLFDQELTTGDWGDLQSPKDDCEKLADDDVNCGVPRVLRQLENAGVHFNRTPDNQWKFGEEATAKVHKNLSVIFSVDTICTSQDIIFGFDAAGIDADYITLVQRRNSNRMWVVSFVSVEHKCMAPELPFITICGCQVFLGDAEHETVLIKIYEAPNEMPDTVLIGRLSYYGRVLSFRHDRLGQGLFNGVRTARIRLRTHIPLSLSIVGDLVMIYYDSQPRSCRCCKMPRCFNCDESRHRKDQCPNNESCNVCFDEKHRTAYCPFALMSSPKRAWHRGKRIIRTRQMASQEKPTQLSSNRPWPWLRRSQTERGKACRREEERGEETARGRKARGETSSGTQ